MQAASTLQATIREHYGKGSARSLRRDGKIPAVIYGEDKPNVTIALESNEITREYYLGNFFSKIVELKTDKESFFALPKAIQLHPLTDFVEHADFLRVSENSEVNVRVPVRFKNRANSVGLKRGGALNIVRHAVEVVCHVDAIPRFLEVDLLKVKIGESIHISHIPLPEGVRPAITSRDFTVATITGKGKKKDEETTEASAATATEESAAA